MKPAGLLPSGRALVQSVIIALVTGAVIAWAMKRSTTLQGLESGG